MIETRDVVVTGAPAPAFYAAPSQARGAVVVVHEIFGRTAEMERVCVRLANAGYAALMPDLFGDRFKPMCVAKALKAVKSGRGENIDVIKDAADVVARESGVARARVGVIGFCLGGGFALAVGNAFAATSANYGELPDEDVMRKLSPTVACFGTRDRSTRKTIPILERRLQQQGVAHEIHVLTAGHAFLTDGSHPVAGFLTRGLLDVDATRDAAAREQGWSRILAFFEQHLA